MRTVTFSDAAVAEAVNTSCVSTWSNRVPEFHNCQYQTEEWILKSSPDCFATKNFTTFFCTPDKKVLHYFTGYFSAKLFLEELEFVKTIAENAIDEKGKLNAAKVRELHGARAAKRSRQAQDTQNLTETRGDWQKQLALRSLGEGLGYLSRVSLSLEKMNPKPLETMIKEHLSGNNFTEEKSEPARK
jgi:hypothetical protein